MNCVFCKIASGEIPAKKVYEDDLVIAFEDIAPVAPIHILVIPKAHIESAAMITPENSSVIAHIYEVIAQIAKEKDFAADGFRVVTNSGKNSGQTEFHLHFHILAGTKLDMKMC